MKSKLICIGVFFIFLFTTVTSISVLGTKISIDELDESLIFKYTFPTPTIEKIQNGEKKYDVILMENHPNFGLPGEPNLPIKDIKLLLPQNTKLKDIKISYGNKVSLGKNFLIEPVEISVPISMINSALEPIPNDEIYNSETLFPEKLFTKVGIQSFRGYKILILTLHPIQYIPKTGELFYYQDLTLNVDLINEQNTNILYRGLEKDKNEIFKKVDNPSFVNKYDYKSKNLCVKDEKYDLLILTESSFVGEFQRLAQRHNEDGVNTIIRTLNGINSAEGIRNIIKDSYEEYGIEYVLLGGDQEIIPAKKYIVTSHGMGDNIENDIVYADLYYACLDGNGPGGTTDDLTAEVNVGRACVSNIDEVKNFVDKTIKYMDTIPNDRYLKDVLMVGEKLFETGWEPIYGGNHLDEHIDNCNNDRFSTFGIPSNFYNIQKLYDKNYNSEEGWLKEELYPLLTNNPHIVNHLGHGSQSHVMKLDEPVKKINNMVIDYNSFDFSNNVKNDKPFLFYSASCLSGDFTIEQSFPYKDCIVEYMTAKSKYGAFAAIANSGYGYCSFGGSMTGPSQALHREFWDAIFGENIQILGKIFQDSKEDNLFRIRDMYPDSLGTNLRNCYYGLNLLGDPAIRIKSLPQNNNNPPSKPEITDPIFSDQNRHIDINITSFDPDGDRVMYLADWGELEQSQDGWTNFYSSGEKVKLYYSYPWYNPGTFDIRVKAKDDRGAESQWSDPLSVTINKSIKSYTQLFDFFARLPFIQRILKL